jgi:hypothetical protein
MAWKHERDVVLDKEASMSGFMFWGITVAGNAKVKIQTVQGKGKWTSKDYLCVSVDVYQTQWHSIPDLRNESQGSNESDIILSNVGLRYSLLVVVQNIHLAVVI